MDFKTHKDVEAGQSDLYRQLCDFDRLETRMADRGVSVTRTASPGGDLVGTAWDARFRLKGKNRSAKVTLESATPEGALVFRAVSAGLEITTHVTLVPMSPGVTRFAVEAALRPHSLTARLLVQSLKLARGRLDDRFAQRVSDYAVGLAKQARAVG